MKKLTAILLIGFLCLLGFVLTKMTYEPIDSLIRLPKIEGENSEIQAAFESSIDSGYIFKSPLAGEYRTSFIRKDIDMDSSDEVIVFYSKTDALDVIRINILDKINGAWESISDIESTYNDIHQIKFADIDADGVTEIIVCWRNFENELLNMLDVYKVTGNGIQTNIKSVFSRNYSEFIVCDVNNDSKKDILIFEKNVNNTTAEIKGTYFNFTVDDVIASGEISLDPTISSIGSVCYDYELDYLRVYVDGYKTDTGITTDIIYWDEYENTLSRLENYDYASIATVATRSKNIYSSDINGDSVIEVPVENYLPYSKVYSDDSQETAEQNIIVWMQHDGENFVECFYEIFNPDYDYSMRIPVDSLGDFTLTNDISNGTMTFYSYYFEDPPPEDKKPKKQDENRDDRGNHPEGGREIIKEEMFAVLVVSDQDYEIHELNGYRLLTTDNGFNYYYQLYQTGKERGITKETIKSMLLT